MTIGAQFISIDADIDGKITKAIAELELNLGRVFAGIVEEAFVSLVQETPQWSGFMTASWNMTVNRVGRQTAVESDYPQPENPYQKGHSRAVIDALSRAEGKSKSFKDRFQARGWTIHVNNAVPYARMVNSGEVKLRTNVGHSPGFFERFEARINGVKVPPQGWSYYSTTDFLGQGQTS
jgi:hypothetical protein